jgi:hypothetical protein
VRVGVIVMAHHLNDETPALGMFTACLHRLYIATGS